MYMRSILFRWLPVLVWAAVIFLVSANPDPYRALPQSWAGSTGPVGAEASSRDELLGRFLHVGEYALLGALTLRALGWHKQPGPAVLLAALGLCGLYGLSDELHQIFVPGRAFQLLDLALDLGGALSGVALYLHFCQSRRNSNVQSGL